jgi:hypothetical protein
MADRRNRTVQLYHLNMIREQRCEYHCEQYICNTCSYTTVDKSNSTKHAHAMSPRRICFGIPSGLTVQRATPHATMLAWFKTELYNSKSTPTSTDGLAELIASIPYSTLHRLLFGNIVDAMRKLFATTWSRDTVTNNESREFQTVFRWRNSIVQFRSILGSSRTIDDFEIITIPATKTTYQELAFELFCTIGDIAFFVSNPSNREALGEKYLPRAAIAWKTTAMRGIPDITTPASITGYRQWMDPIVNDIERFIPTRESLFEYRQPEHYTTGRAICLDHDAPTHRLICVHVCTSCRVAHPNKQRIARHVRTCKLGLAKSVAVTTCWYTKSERERYDPFGPAAPIGFDRIHELDPVFSTAHAARIVAESISSTGADRIVDVFRVCFSKYAHDPAWCRAIRCGRYVHIVMPVDGTVQHEKIPINRVFRRFASWIFSITDLASEIIERNMRRDDERYVLIDPTEKLDQLETASGLMVGDLINGNPSAFKTDFAKRLNERIVKTIPTLNEFHNEIILE